MTTTAAPLPTSGPLPTPLIRDNQRVVHPSNPSGHLVATIDTMPDTATESQALTTATDARKTMVDVERLTKRVTTSDGELVIVNNANFTVAAGEAVAVVGASGSGKSTLLGLMAGLDVPSEGRVRIHGEDLFALDEDGRALLRGRLVGFVFQSFQLLPSLTALENVMLPLELAGVADAEARANTILARVGLAARVKHYPKQLSGGEQQRVAIARAFVTEPRLLFADEPTGNLDAKTGRAMIDLLFELNRERGTTLILVTHDLNLAARCNRRLVIEAGVVQAEDSPPQMAM
jgi:putative ABC transport system ATP-binding protein